MTYHSSKNEIDFNCLVEMGLRRARVERSRAFFDLFSRISRQRHKVRELSEG